MLMLNMSSIGKDGRSFREARTSKEEEMAIEAVIPMSTRYKNIWAIEVIREWQYYRSLKSQTSNETSDKMKNRFRMCLVFWVPIIHI